MSFVELILLAVSLAMDAFAVSICGSMFHAPENRSAGAWRFGIWFGFFQFVMPIIGYFAAVSFRSYIVDYDHWIAFALLAYLGIRMIKEAPEACLVNKVYTDWEMTLLAIATSIDALAVGVSLAFINANIWLAATMVGLVTFFIAFTGGLLGFRLGAAVGKYANILGGILLIGIGTRILLEHLGYLA